MAENSRKRARGARVARRLRRAVAVIGQRGWCQRDIEDDDGRVCLVGALRLACGIPATPNWWGELKPLAELVDVVGRAVGSRGNLGWWNDRPDRTAGQVVAMLGSAADAEDPEGAGDWRIFDGPSEPFAGAWDVVVEEGPADGQETQARGSLSIYCGDCPLLAGSRSEHSDEGHRVG